VARFGTRRLCVGDDGGVASAVVFTPDGKHVVSACWLEKDKAADTAIQVWDASTGALVARFGDQEGGVVSLAMSRDGKLLATGGKEGTIDLWDFPARKRLLRLREGKRGMPDLAFSADGKSLISTAADAQVWDVRTGKLLKEYLCGHENSEHDMTVSADGKVLVTSAYFGKELAARDLTTGKLLYTAPAGRRNVALTVAPNEPAFAAVGKDGLLGIHELRSGKVLRQWRVWSPDGGGKRMKPLAFSPNGKVLATGDAEGVIKLWDPRDGKLLRRFSGCGTHIEYLSFSPDGKLLAYWGDNSTVRLLDATTGRRHVSLPGHVGLIDSVAAFAGGDLFASAGDHRVLIWDRRKPAPASTFSADDPSVLSCAGTDLLAFSVGRLGGVLVCRRTAVNPVAEFQTGHYVAATCLSPDGKFLACADNKATVRLYSVAEKKLIGRVTFPLGGREFLSLYGLAFSPDGHRLAVAFGDGTVRVCDAATLGELSTLTGGNRLTEGGFVSSFGAVAYDPTSTHLAALGEGRLLFWRARTGNQIRRIKIEPKRNKYSLAFSPDGRFLATALEDEEDHSLALWEVRSGKEVARFKGHEGGVRGVCFLDRGRQILSASRDHTMLLWDRTMPADRPAGLDAAWKALAGDADNAHAALWQVVRAPGAEAFLAKQLTPAVPAAKGLPERIAGWLADLAGKDAAARKEAQEQLAKHLDYAEGAVLRASDDAATAEAQARFKPLLAKVTQRQQSAERLRTDRALAALEYRATAEAKAVLKKLAGGPAGHWQTDEAAAALRRLEQTSAVRR
jgi:WD40 repeat protein